MNNKEIPSKYILIYSERHESYDLFKDLKGRNDVQLIVTKEKKVSNQISKSIRKVHLSSTIANRIRLPLKHIWYEKTEIMIEDNAQYYLIIVDMALNTLPLHYIKKIANKKNVKTVLVMINSVKSNTIRQIHTEMNRITWDAILTFDNKDAEKYGYKNIGYCYYSMHERQRLETEFQKEPSDAYFIGTIKSSRKREILGVYEALRGRGLKVDFYLLKTIKEKLNCMPYEDEIHYFTSKEGLIPYDEILASVLRTKTIIEIIQEGQSGPSLRYYEAVCYNKKLLTNNPNIVSFPFYDSRYMKVYKTPEDIDIDWLCEEYEVNYHYNDEFSPNHLIENIKKLDNDY